jgi:hypothetical protein
MADSGYNWDTSWSFFQKSSSNWSSDAITDTNNEAGDGLSQDNKAATEVSITIAGGSGTVDGVVTISILGDIDGTNYEDITNGNPVKFDITPVVSTTVRTRFIVYGSDFSEFNVNIENQSGITVTISVRYKQATIPPAS